MPTITPDGTGELRQSVTQFSDLTAWFDGQPLVDGTANVFSENPGRRSQGIYCLYAIVGPISFGVLCKGIIICWLFIFL